MRLARYVGSLCAAVVGMCAAAGADVPVPLGASLEIARPIGDTYSERSSDGDAYPQSLGVRAVIGRDRDAIVLDYRRNVYQTETRGAGTLTSYARIEGGTGTAVPFLARESSFEGRFERRVGNSRVSVGVGVLRTWTNYDYPSLTGIGFGVEQRAAPSPGLRPFGSAFYYPAATGSYTTEQLPRRTMTTAFRILKLDYGFTLRDARSPLYLVAGYGNEFRRGNGLSFDNRFVRSDPYLAIGTRLR